MARRRFLRMSLRTLFVTVGVVCLTLAYVRAEIDRGRRERATFLVLKARGALVRYTYENVPNRDRKIEHDAWGPNWAVALLGEDWFRSIHHVTFNKRHLGDAELAYLKDLRDLPALELFRSAVTDDGMAELKSLGNLKRLSTWQLKITDRGLNHLQEVRQLQKLSLGESGVTDAGIKHLKTLRLHTLDLTGCRISDAGVKEIAEMKTLRILGLVETDVTDACVESLATLPLLQEVGLSGTAVTSEAIAELKAAIPGLLIL